MTDEQAKLVDYTEEATREANMKNDPKWMDPLTRAEINEIERRKREENDARAKAIFGSAAGAKHPRLS